MQSILLQTDISTDYKEGAFFVLVLACLFISSIAW